MSIIGKVEEPSKAGLTKQLRANLILVNLDNKTIMHRYSVDQLDSDGDLNQVLESKQVTLGPEAFDQWVTSAMKEATKLTMEEDYKASKETEEEA